MEIYKSNQSKYQEACIEFLNKCAENSTLYVTLTYKTEHLPDLNVCTTYDVLKAKEDVHRNKISQSLNHCRHLLNRKLFGNNARRKQLSISYLPFIEFGRNKSVHAHILVGVPEVYTKCRFRMMMMIRDCHFKTKYHNNFVYVSVHDNNLSKICNYNLKESFEAVDLNNIVLTDKNNKIIKTVN